MGGKYLENKDIWLMRRLDLGLFLFLFFKEREGKKKISTF